MIYFLGKKQTGNDVIYSFRHLFLGADDHAEKQLKVRHFGRGEKSPTIRSSLLKAAFLALLVIHNFWPQKNK